MAGRAPRTSMAGAAGAGGARFAIVAARFHEPICKALVDGALRAFVAHGVTAGRVEVHWVPGSFELPVAAQALARTRRFAALACVGVVIRGATPHFEHIARETAAGLRQVGLATGLPVTFGVVTALTEEQAWERAGGSVGNRGEEAALAALEMASLVGEIRAGAGRGRARAPRRRGRRRAEPHG